MSKFFTFLAAGLLAAALPLATAQAATYTAQEKANIKLVEDFYAALDKGDAAGDIKQKIRGIAEQYLAPDYIQHAEVAGAPGQGREGFIRFFEQLPPMPGPPPSADGASALPPAKVLAIMADGDLVIRVNSRSMPAPGGAATTSYVFNMFRIQSGKLAEHWDSSGGGMKMPPGAGPGLPPGDSEKP